MKKIISGEIPARVLVAVFYTLAGAVFFGGISALSFLVAELTQKNERWIYVFYAGVFLLMSALAAFSIGFEQSRRLYKGRAVGFPELTWPGTILPQNKGLFCFRGAHELGNGWVVAVFQKVTEMQCLTDSSGKMSRKDLFCVLTREEILPRKPCLVKLEYDQHASVRATEIPAQTPGLN